MDHNTVFFGEIGLGGELRPVSGGQDRIVEAAKHGFSKAVVPKSNAPRKKIEGMEIHAVSTLQEALTAAGF